MIITTDGNIPSKFAHSFNVTKMAQGFFRAGEKVELVSFSSFRNWLYKIKVGDFRRYYGLSPKIKLKFLMTFGFDFLAKTIGNEKFSQKAAKYIKSQNPDFVYCRSYLTPYYCVKEGLPTIMETHTKEVGDDLKKVFSVANDKNFLGIVTIHKNLKKLYENAGVPEEKILVAEDGVDLDLFNINDDRFFWRKELNLPADKKLAVYVGGLYKEKGIEQILLAAQKLHDKNIDFVLVGGNKNQIGEWKKYCAKENIGNVVFAGFAPQTDVPKYLKAADVLIMPYDTRVDFKVMDINSTSPLKLFEFMASRRPIVSTALPVIEKVVKHGESAFLASPNNIEQLSGFILEAANNAQKSALMASKAFELAKQYDWKVRCRKIIDKFVKNR
ncbi:MAG TPA: glycosyltransferase [Candidatus Bipolaricaulota bacterium]|nr:glycosyltransferase [Candidatus Bipolaricaulota bacterium]